MICWKVNFPVILCYSMGNLSDKSCVRCGKDTAGYNFKSGKMCVFCFYDMYGGIILNATNGEYYGGHKAYVAGGFARKYELGQMLLTDKFFIFFNDNDKKPEKNFEIVIPLKFVITDSWKIEEESRRQQISGVGIGGITGMGIGAGFGSGTIHDEGKAHHIVIPYMDENGIRQEPRFGISSFGGKAIREWSQKVYEQIVTVRKSVSSNSEVTMNIESQQDPLTVLKLRLAKGEIDKDEYEQLRKLLEK